MLRFLTAGESHGPQLTAILEGLPAGLPIDRAEMQRQMARRQKGYGSGGRMRIETDAAIITAGVMAGQTTGGPIAMNINNKDYEKWAERAIKQMTIPRPGHADLTGAVKYGYRELRLSLERASARETAARVAVGALCKQLLAAFGIQIGSYVVQIGQVKFEMGTAMPDYLSLFQAAETNDVRCPHPDTTQAMRAAIKQTMLEKDTIGGVFEVVALGLPTGLGSHVHWDRRLSGRLMAAVGSIQAIKGVEIGVAFTNAALLGSQVHDELFLAADGNTLTRHTNAAGGLEGGMTTGEPLVIRAAMKPISTVLKGRRSVDLVDGSATATIYERSDVCAVPRAAIVGEAMVAYTLADALLQKLGGDNLAELQSRFTALRQSRLSDLPMDNTPWGFEF